MRRNRKNKGFTLVELITVLVILSIIAAIAVPFFVNYWKKAEFQKNEANAKTVYLAAESRLTYYRSSEQWEDFKKQILEEGIPYPSDGSELAGRIYAVTLGAKAYRDEDAADSAVLKLLNDYIYDKGFFNGTIGIEIDVESGEVYSAFYGTKSKGLTYEEDDADGYLTMRKRDYDSRSKRLLGYYSTEDTVNVVSLKPKKLRITSINLVNSEKLYLNWASNVGGSQDVSYEISFFQDETGKKLFSLTMSPFDMAKNGWSGNEDGAYTMAKFLLKDADGQERETYAFPVTYSDGKYSLVLDAMMSVKVQAMLQAGGTADAVREREKLYSTSIQRLGEIAQSLEIPTDIYATVQAVSYAGTEGRDITTEYRPSEAAKSNTANTMFADGSACTGYDERANLKIASFRHLSNIRYYPSDANLTLTARNMDWASVGTGLYESETIEEGTHSKEVISWEENTPENTVNFPSIPELAEGQTLQGNGNRTLISNLSLGETSIMDDTIIGQVENEGNLYGDLEAKYLGLFMELSGDVKNVTLQDPVLELGVEDAGVHSFSRLEGAGILAGRLDGNLSHVSITLSKKMAAQQKADPELATVKVSLANGAAAYKISEAAAAVGGVAGIASEWRNGQYVALGTLNQKTGKIKEVCIENVSMEGRIIGKLPSAKETAGSAADEEALNEQAAKLRYGVGGILGYANMKMLVATEGKSPKLLSCENHASVSGNMFTGGIAGKIDSTLKHEGRLQDSDAESRTNIMKCTNDGLVLCTEEQVTDTSVDGHYFGGIAGFANQVLINRSTSASGRAEDFSYTAEKKNLLLGDYVGGIVGYGNGSLVYDCSTEKNGYVLGADYVGGIAGGFGDTTQAIWTDGENVKVTTNVSYVIGNNYVGGIVGKNTENVTLDNCVNNGVVAGYEKYIGGIVGYNDNATISDCASYLSDYDNSVFNMVVSDWKAVGDYAGGIAGYNNGKITFSGASQKITVKSVASIVVGQNYIGGIAGFNDVGGELDVHYTLIGGRIYAYGNCAGGAFGLNASTKTLEQELAIKPQSVQGTYYVGGCIGANVVDLAQETTMSQIRTDNILGSITGDAFVGGIVGYQRTYTAEQLDLKDSNTPIRAALEQNLSSAGTAGKMLPQLNADRIPTAVLASANTHTLTITTADNGGLTKDTNNMPIRANIYVGGITGYCEKNSKLVMKDCKNSGNISRASSEDGAVDLKKFVQSAELTGIQNVDDGISLHFVGGITGVNLENEVIDNCANTGSVTGFAGIGGVVGLNAGLVYRCALNENFGNAALNYIGGIAGINIGSGTAAKTYDGFSYQAGTIDSCTTAEGKTIAGLSDVGGIAGWNAPGGKVKENGSYANITASGSRVGGTVGRNSGSVEVGVDNGTKSRSIDGRNGEGIGGIVGVNESTGTIQVTGKTSGSDELVAVGAQVSIRGNEKVGGIVGINRGSLGEAKGTYLTCQAKLVRAAQGTVGGIAGTTSGSIQYAKNRAESVSADAGYAGGIVAENTAGKTISNCENHGNVTSSDGYAGGIAALNEGTIADCSVSGTDAAMVTIQSRGTKEIGAVTAVNNGTITASAAAGNVILNGQAVIFGGITGVNNGTVGNTTDFAISYMPQIESTGKQLTVGGAVGVNNGEVQHLLANLDFVNFNSYQYLGGIVGENGVADAASTVIAAVKDSSYSGTITENGGTAGNCYGGISGINYASLENCKIDQINMTVVGVYTATSTSTAEQKEQLATHAGGITGKNETTGVITGCLITDTEKSSMSAQYGMLGGVAGFNKGSIELSGSDKTAVIMADVTDADGNARVNLTELNRRAGSQNLRAESNYVTWQTNSEIENMQYSNRTNVSSDRMKFLMITNGNIGGITAYNGTDGTVTKCVSGNWFLNNKSEAISVGTGGIIGMNESEKDLSYLVNGAFVGRQIKSGTTNRFAGGIIGNQNNITSSDWNISYCINYGTVYCYNSHYSGGIMGQWTGSGGTIEKCLNYGMLQTTYAQSWVGASGGIVAQLYHAYENQEYNIISCGNYGNIYKRSGPNGDGANDSAGILGNITNYKVGSTAQAQKFTVQILDCFNAPGVKIYSSSMASGIFGFLSCDKADTSAVNTSTRKVVMRLERCRNFANTLSGNQYIAGIFGDRYQTEGWKNTTIKDCYSVSPGSSYSNNHALIVSAWSGNSKGYYQNNLNQARNYYLDGYSKISSFTGVQIYEAGSSRRGSGTVSHDQDANGLKQDGYSRYAIRMYVMQNATTGNYFVAAVNANTTIQGKNCYIDGTAIKNNSGTQLGKILYYIDKNKPTGISNAVTNPSDLLFVNARETWRTTEGIISDGITKKLEKPLSASTEIRDGKVTVSNITMPNEDDPFAYEVKVVSGTGEYTHILYTENGAYNLPSDFGGNPKVYIRAFSMYEDVEASDWLEVTDLVYDKILPDPDVRIDLVPDTSTKTYHAYRFSLNNLSDYMDTDANGKQLYPNWQVEVKVPGVSDIGTIVLNASSPTVTRKTDSITANYTYQMTARASVTGTATSTIQASKEVSTSIFIPRHYRPLVSLNDWNPLKIDCTVEGSTLDDLAIAVVLDSKDSIQPDSQGKKEAMDVPPIYRAELVGDWTDEAGTTYSDVVFAKSDILIVDEGKASATLTDFADYLARGKNFKIRIWYAASGLGPVYTYYPVTTEAEANVKELTGETDGTPEWNYVQSTVLKNTGGYYTNYQKTISSIFTWLPAPVLSDTVTLDQSTGTLMYTFTWDSDLTTANPQYEVSLVGIDSEDREVVIDIGDAYTGGKSLTVDGSDWNYTQVKLKVTRKGGTSTGTGGKQIGLSSTETYTIRPRLSQPGQASVNNTDVNELNYELTWAPISPENAADCAGYQAYIRVYDGDTLGDAKTLGELILLSEKRDDGTYAETVNLEDYAGKRVVIYLVAEATENGAYLRSVDGVTTELRIPNRLPEPNVTWKVSWKYEYTAPVEAEAFENGTLHVDLTADAGSIPPGGSAYLLKAYVYNSQAEAEASSVSDLGTPIAYYPPGSIPGQEVSPVQMDMASSTSYYHNMKELSIRYAGKWVVFYARISSGNGNVSSKWTKSQSAYQLPYVKLQTPAVTSGETETAESTIVTNTPNVPGTEKQWNATHTSLEWDGVESADLYTVALNGKVTENDGNSRRDLAGYIRILENEAADGTKTPAVQYSADGNTYSAVPLEGDAAAGWNGTLDGYKVEIASNYNDATGGVSYYEKLVLTTKIVITENADGSFHYKLILPDTTAMVSDDNMPVTHDNFTITQSATVGADVRANLNGRSDAYTASDAAEIKWNN